MNIAQKLENSGLTFDAGQSVIDAVAIYNFLFHSIGEDGLIDVSAGLHRGPGGFHKWKRDRVEDALVMLEKRGTFSASTAISGSGGKPKQHRYLSPDWSRANGKTYEELVEVLVESLIAAVDNEIPPVVAAQVAPVALVDVQAVHIPPDTAVRVLVDSVVVCSTSGFGGTQNVSAGQIISDPIAIKALIASGAPVVPVTDLTSTCCPMCRTIYDSEDVLAVWPELPPLIVLRDCSFGFNGVTITRKRGDIVSDHLMSAHLLGQESDEVAVANPGEASKCPKCQHIFAVARIAGNREATLLLRAKLAPIVQAKREAEEVRRVEQEKETAALWAKMQADAAAKTKMQMAPGLSRIGD